MESPVQREIDPSHHVHRECDIITLPRDNNNAQETQSQPQAPL
jgi:hypothetical protein